MLAFKVDKQLLFATALLFLSFVIFISCYDFFRKKKFYDSLLQNMKRLDQSYFVLETIDAPRFYEGQLLFQVLYESNKSMVENVGFYRRQTQDFKDYIEMWIHEVKIPIASLLLMAHNQKEKFDKKMIIQMHRIENDVEQVLYYARQEFASKDYSIRANNLREIIRKVALKNKDDLLENEMDLIVENVDVEVLTDAKWLEFICHQIINNSIKYKKEKGAILQITAAKKEEKIVLSILDNGIGIPACDLPQVFEKSFTGRNGRQRFASTGMGLYIAKNLCEKLGHKIEITSKEGKYTRVDITFFKNTYFDVIK